MSDGPGFKVAWKMEHSMLHVRFPSCPQSSTPIRYPWSLRSAGQAFCGHTTQRDDENAVTIKGHNSASVLLVSHDIKGVVYMADRIVILGARPGRVRTVVENRLLRPCDYRSSGFLKLVDELHELITGHELPDAPPAPPGRERPILEPLPQAEISAIIGLLEYLDARGGKEDIFRIAQDTNSEFGRMLAVVEAAELLELVDTPRRMVILEPEGQRFVRAGPEERKVIWRGQLLKLRLFQTVHDVLQRQPEHAVDRDFVLETLVMHLPQENYEKLFSTFIRWARFANLFSYDETSQTISLQ